MKSGKKSIVHNQMYSFSNNQISESDILGKQFNTFHENNGHKKIEDFTKDLRFSDIREDLSENLNLNRTINENLVQEFEKISQKNADENNLRKSELLSINDIKDRSEPFEYDQA